MKLCFLANAASIHTQRWATYFSQRGHEVTVVSLAAALIDGIDVRVIGPDPESWGRAAYILCLPRLKRILRELQPDIVHAHYAGGYGMTSALAGYHPLVITAWGTDVLILPRDSRPLGWVIRRSLRKADLVTSMAQHMTATMQQLGVDSSRIITLPFGVDTAIFHPPEQRRGDPEGAWAPQIVSTLHLQPLYNVGLLLEALPEVLKVFPLAQTLLIGEGRERETLRARADSLGLNQHATFLGRKTPAEIAGYLSAADVFVSTSLSDGNNISLNEAMACGAFPVATDIPANREWIRHGENGFLTGTRKPQALAAFLIQALRDDALRRSAAAINWNTIQRRGSWSAAMETMETHYTTLIGQRPQTAGARRAASGSHLAAGVREP